MIRDFAKKHEFKGTILDVGALDVNGSLSQALPVTLRVDMRPGKGVDEVVNACDLLERFGPESWDNVVSAEMLEHAQDWRGAMINMWGVLRPGGAMLLTMASIRKGRHAYPDDYWRFPLDRFMKLFGSNEIIAKMDHKITIGAIVRKSGPLTLDIDPDRVP